MNNIGTIKINKKSNKVLMFYIALFLFTIITFTSIILAGIKFNEKSEGVIVKGNVGSINLEEIKHLVLCNHMSLLINYSDSYNLSPSVPLFTMSNISLKRKGDTLLVLPIEYKGEKWYPNDAQGYIQLNNLESIDLEVRSNVSIVNYSNKMQVKARSGSSVFIKNATKKGIIEATAFDNARVNAVNFDNITAHLSDESCLSLKNSRLNINGVIRNRSYIETAGLDVNIKNLIKRDSSAVLFK